MSGWAAFWLFMIVFFLVDTAVFLGGINTFFYQYSTPAELEKQRQLLGLEPAK